jgi:hypothetical protein
MFNLKIFLILISTHDIYLIAYQTYVYDMNFTIYDGNLVGCGQ